MNPHVVKPLALAMFASATFVTVPSASAEVNINLRTFYMNRDFTEGSSDHREALTQAVRLDYSGKITESMGIGASLFSNARIHDDGDSNLTGLLTSDTSEGYAKLGQVYADFNFGDRMSLRLGRWVMGTALLNDSDSRATPSSTQAIKLKAAFDSGQVYFVYSDRASSKTESQFKQYLDGNGNDYGIALIGGDIALDNGVSLAAAYGDADGFKEQLYLNAGMQLSDTVTMAIHHYRGDGEGTNAAFDSNLTNLMASYQLDNLKLSAGYQTVSGDSGYNYTWGGQDDNGLQTSNSVQILDFNNQDEDSWQLRADYQVESIAGLTMMARHTWGEYTSGSQEVDESETNFEMAYTLASGSLEGLNLRMRASHVEADAFDDINEIRLIANYSF